MAGYNFEIENIRGSDNKVADTLSQVGECLDKDAVKELLDQGIIKELLNHAAHYGIPRAEANDPRVTKEHERQRVRSLCRCECWPKQRKIIRI